MFLPTYLIPKSYILVLDYIHSQETQLLAKVAPGAALQSSKCVIMCKKCQHVNVNPVSIGQQHAAIVVAKLVVYSRLLQFYSLEFSYLY